MYRAAIRDGIEFHLVNGRIFLTSEADPNKQISMSMDAVNGLLSYLAQEGVIAGHIKFVEAHPGGAVVYRLAVEDTAHLEDTVSCDLLIHKGEITDFATVGDYVWTPEDHQEYYAGLETPLPQPKTEREY